MGTRSEIFKKFKKLRKEQDEHYNSACRLEEEIKELERITNERIVGYYLKNGGLDGRYFKSPSYDQSLYTDDPANVEEHSVQCIYIKRLINITKNRVTFYGQQFPLPLGGRHSEYSSISLDLQTTSVDALHPEYEIDKIDFANALAEWKKRSDKFVEDLINCHKKRNLSSNVNCIANEKN